MRKLRRGIALLLIFFACLFALGVLLPRHYSVPQMQALDGIHFLDLPTGSHIAYTRLEGRIPKKSTPVIFLQGGPGGFITARTIAQFTPLTSDGYDVYLYDQIGSGHSARLADIREYTAGRHERDLDAIVKNTGAGQVILIGQSWGAILAALFVADHPEKVAKIIFTSPGPIPPLQPGRIRMKAPDNLHLRPSLLSNARANADAGNLRSRAMQWCALWLGKKLAADEEADAFQTFLNNGLNKSTVCDTAKAQPAAGGGGYYAQVMTIAGFARIKDPRQKLKGRDLPVLVMKGQCDNQPWGVTAEYLELFRNSRLVTVPDAGHAISVEQPGLFLNAIRTFLNGNQSADDSAGTKRRGK